jgi:predicted GIY-YIG superfamily endonuclease
VRDSFARARHGRWKKIVRYVNRECVMSVVYLLESSQTRRTYVGCAGSDVQRRLRQHNGELAGGAKQTETGRPWKIACVVSGFRTRNEALKFEYAWRRVHRAARCNYVKSGRLQSLDLLMQRERWSSRSPLAKNVPLTVVHTGQTPTGGSSFTNVLTDAQAVSLSSGCAS